MNVYIKAQESVCLVHPEIKIKDIMSLYCIMIRENVFLF